MGKINLCKCVRRDLFTCQLCGDKNGSNLEVHHLKQFAKIIRDKGIKTIEEAKLCLDLWDISNGQTLCKRCHKKTDSYLKGRIINS